MDLATRLLLLLEVNELGTFAKVAELRNVDRSVISKQINKLEDELGVRLLNRTTRSLSITAAGHEMLKQAKQMRNLLDETKRIAQNYHDEPKGTLKITSSSYFGRQYVQKVAVAFQQKYPDVQIELRFEDRIVDLIGESYDVGFRFGEPKDSSLIAKKLAPNRMLIVASPKFIEKYGSPKTVKELEKLPAVIYATTGLVADSTRYKDACGRERQIKLNVAYKVNEVDSIIEAAESGNMFAVVSSIMVGDLILQGKLVPIMTELNLLDFGSIFAMYPHRNPPQKTSIFIDMVLEAIGKDAPHWDKNIPNFDQLYQASDLKDCPQELKGCSDE